MGRERFEDRLRRLRREDVPAQALGDARRKGMPAWLKRHLGRADAIGEEVLEGDYAPKTVGAPEGLEVVERGHGPLAARETRLEEGDRHGDYRLDEVRAADGRTIAMLTGDAALADVDLTRAVYLDTETTGLSGGAGIYVYMVGLGAFEDGAYKVWQGFLREPNEERAVLDEVARRIRSADLVVSFFGKSFDRHRLEDKMRIAGVEPPFADLPHLDLYHPFRRLTKGRLPDGRLATMESNLCGLARESDLPGALAPAAWFDFLAGRPHRLEGVFQHNLDDVLSLVTLAAYLGRTREETRVGGEPLAGCAIGRARALAQAALETGDREEAMRWIDAALEREREAGGAPRDFELLRADTLRLANENESARMAYEELAGGPEDVFTVPALLGLAKLLEHRTKDVAAAHEQCLRAERLLAHRHTGTELARLERDLERRTARLAGKLAKRVRPS